MVRLKFTLKFIGAPFSGWQEQPNAITIQQITQEAIQRVLKQPMPLIGAGRTDAGVHALAYVCHGDLPTGTRFGGMSAIGQEMLDKFCYSINSQLPPQISITRIEVVAPDFHCRQAARRKSYVYYLYQSPQRSPFLDAYAWRVVQPLDWQRIRRAARQIIGLHDFACFAASDRTTKTTERRIYSISIRPVGNAFLDPDQGLWRIRVVGNGFLKHMVRTIVGTLVDIGRGRTTLLEWRQILASGDRRRAGMNAPAKGLFLEKVYY